MIENIVVKINGKDEEIQKGITLQELAKIKQHEYKYPIILAKVDNHIKELSSAISQPCNIEFLDITTREGNRAHISGLVFIIIYVVKELFGAKEDIRVAHSIDKGIYINTTMKIMAEEIDRIKTKMNEIVASDLDITKVNVDRFDAIDYFNKINDLSKVGVMTYNTNTFVTLYRLGNLYNYFYYYMPVSTECLKNFDLTYIDDHGFVLRFPTVYINDTIKEYENHPKMFEMLNESRRWAKILKVENSASLNKMVSTSKISDLIRMSETISNNRLLEIANDIKNTSGIKIVLLAGPSSSGKTTTTRKLCLFLKSFGIIPHVISMDDYFVDKDKNPIGIDGNPDFECLEAVDVSLFDSQIEELLSGKEVVVPTYNFILGKKEFTKKMQVGESDIILIEGIHALDPQILTNIERQSKYKIYLSALTELNMDRHNRISTTDNRLLRRIVRDNRTRGYGVEKTLASWKNVRMGEEKYIFPYQDDANVIFNTELIYEIGALKTYVEPLLYAVDFESPYYEEAIRLLNFLRLFLPIPADDIPKDSILREFIGGSCFHD